MSSAGRDALVAMLSRLKNDLSRADLNKPARVSEALKSKYPLNGDYLAEVRRLCERGLEEGWLCPAGEGERSRRVRVAGTSTWFPFAIEATLLEGETAGHATPKGEVGLWWPLAGKPRYDGSEPGWTVLSPGSEHYPKVTGGRLFMLSFLPDGAIRRGLARANGSRRKAGSRTGTKRKTVAKSVTTARQASAGRS